jgi:hypothetical protein
LPESEMHMLKQLMDKRHQEMRNFSQQQHQQQQQQQQPGQSVLQKPRESSLQSAGGHVQQGNQTAGIRPQPMFQFQRAQLPPSTSAMVQQGKTPQLQLQRGVAATQQGAATPQPDSVAQIHKQTQHFSLSLTTSQQQQQQQQQAQSHYVQQARAPQTQTHLQQHSGAYPHASQLQQLTLAAQGDTMQREPVHIARVQQTQQQAQQLQSGILAATHSKEDNINAHADGQNAVQPSAHRSTFGQYSENDLKAMAVKYIKAESSRVEVIYRHNGRDSLLDPCQRAHNVEIGGRLLVVVRLMDVLEGTCLAPCQSVGL